MASHWKDNTNTHLTIHQENRDCMNLYKKERGCDFKDVASNKFVALSI